MTGINVSDTIAENAMASAIVTANSRNSRPIMPPINKSGINAAIRDTLIETTVKPIWRAAWRAAWSGDSQLPIRRLIASMTTMASSTMKPVATVSAISDRLSML